MTNHRDDDNDDDDRRMADLLSRNDTGSFTSDELARKVYEMEKDVLRKAGHFNARLRVIETMLAGLPEQLRDLVTKARFYPVELIAYGLVGGVLLTVLGAILGRVLIK